MPGSEFGALHQAASTARQYLGKLRSQLMEWDRKFDIHNNKFKGRVAKTANEVLDSIASFEAAIPNLEKMEIAAKNDKSVDQEAAFNFEIVFSRYKEKWDEILMPFIKPVIKKDFKFKTVAEMKSVLAGVKQILKDNALKEKVTPKPEEKPVADAAAKEKIKIVLHDSSFATASNSLAATDAPAKAVRKYKIKKKSPQKTTK